MIRRLIARELSGLRGILTRCERNVAAYIAPGRVA